MGVPSLTFVVSTRRELCLTRRHLQTNLSRQKKKKEKRENHRIMNNFETKKHLVQCEKMKFN